MTTFFQPILFQEKHMKSEYNELFTPYFDSVSLPEIPKKKPLISILCPYYKVGDYVEDALHSILEQTYDNWELICIDDASPDTVAYDVIQRINDPRIKYKKLPKNSGAALARNTAFGMSSGDYILCFDPDDILHPFALQLLLSRALSSSSPDIITYDIKVFGSEVSYWRTKIYDERELTRRNWIIGPSYGLIQMGRVPHQNFTWAMKTGTSDYVALKYVVGL